MDKSLILFKDSLENVCYNICLNSRYRNSSYAHFWAAGTLTHIFSKYTTKVI